MVEPSKAEHEHQPYFQHSPLDLHQNSIRLLEVHPRSFPYEPIRCTIREATLSEEYTCLSYVWGPPQPSRLIYINGKPFRVRQNLYDFLKIASSKNARRNNLHLTNGKMFGRSPFHFDKTTHAIWIDALCINQEDSQEKKHQIQLFGSIYLNAEVVVAWMGVNPDLEWLFRVWISRPKRNRVSRHLENLFFERESSMRMRFLQDTYWSRAWTTQESLLAQKLILIASDRCVDVLDALSVGFGTRWKVPMKECKVWAQLRDSNASLYRKEPFGRGMGWSKTFSPPRQKQPYISPFSTLERLWDYREKSCVEPRDKLFSLLSVSSNGHEMNMDYNVTREETALQFLQANQDEFCLCHAVMVFDTMEANVLDLGGIAGSDHRKNFVDVQLHVANESHEGTLLTDDFLRLDLTCHHINSLNPQYGDRSYHTRTFRSGSLRFQKPSASGFGGILQLIDPVYWVDPLSQQSFEFSDDEDIHFAWEHEDSCTLRFSLPAFARLMILLGTLDRRIETVGASTDALDLPDGYMPSRAVTLAAPLMPRYAALEERSLHSETTWAWPLHGQSHVSNLNGDSIPIRIADPNPKWTLLPQLDRPKQYQCR